MLLKPDGQTESIWQNMASRNMFAVCDRMLQSNSLRLAG